jgi:hypothetical protein
MDTTAATAHLDAADDSGGQADTAEGASKHVCEVGLGCVRTHVAARACHCLALLLALALVPYAAQQARGVEEMIAARALHRRRRRCRGQRPQTDGTRAPRHGRVVQLLLRQLKPSARTRTRTQYSRHRHQQAHTSHLKQVIEVWVARGSGGRGPHVQGGAEGGHVGVVQPTHGLEARGRRHVGVLCARSALREPRARVCACAPPSGPCRAR